MKTENGFKERATVGGIFTFDHYRNGEKVDQWAMFNLVPDAGLDYINNSSFGNGTAIANWYIGLYSNAYTPQSDDVYTDIGTRFTEITTQYDELTRPAWVKDGPSAAGLITNSASRAVFTFNTAVTVTGALFVSVNTKGDNVAGTLGAASLHTPARDMAIGDELLVKYEFQATSA